MKKSVAIITLSALSACLCAIETPPPIEPPETFDVPGLAFDETPESSAPNPTAKHFLDGKSFKHAAFSADASGADCSAVMLVKNAEFDVGKIRILKVGGTTNKPASNSIGLNAALSVGSGSRLLIGSGEIRTNADGANAISVWGEGSKAMVKNLEIKTESNFSRALFADDGGLLEAENIVIETRGSNSAAIEAIGGTVSAANITAKTTGQYSPAIRSAGNVAVAKAILSAGAAEAVVIDGPGAVAVTDSNLFARKNCGVLICQRISGGPQNGAAVFDMSGGILASEAKSIFCVTNATCTINLNSVGIRFRSSNDVIAPEGELGSPIDNNDFSKIILINARQGQLGSPDDNGGHVTLNAVNQNLPGVIYADDVSSVEVNLQSSKFTGTANGNVAITLDENSSWTLTSDARVRAVRGNVNNIVTNGHRIFYTAPRR